MKKILAIAMLVMAVTLTGCRSKKAASGAEVSQIQEVQSTEWKNVYAPVTVEILRPMQFTASGRATMVRGESIYLSMRMFGMEVAGLYATPAEALMTMKMPRKMAIELAVADALERSGLSFAEVQEALLGNESALAKLPPSVSCKAETTEGSSVVEIYTRFGGKDLGVRLTWNLRSAKWNQADVTEFRAPGADYTRVSPQEAIKMASELIK